MSFAIAQSKLCKRCGVRYKQFNGLCRQCGRELGVVTPLMVQLRRRLIRPAPDFLLSIAPQRAPVDPPPIRTRIIDGVEYDIVWDGHVRY
jgi:predicted amidophosphoribosyltransferase